MTIETRYPSARCGEPRSPRSRPSVVALVLIALAVAVLLAPAAMAQPRGVASDPLALLAVQRAELTASDGAAQDYFGYSVALSGDTALVGANGKQSGTGPPGGAAYVFVRSGAVWSQQGDALTASDGATGDFFGWSVALSGDVALVGAHGHQVGENEIQGAAYVFVRAGAVWSQQGELTASDGAAGDRFGSSVALSGDTALVGAADKQVGANETQGAAYVFTRSGMTWSQQGGALTASDGAASGQSGWSVALSGDTALVGAPGVNAEQGAAYVFVRAGAAWSQQGGALTASDGAAADGFGLSVALSGDTALVGAPYKQIGVNAEQGAAYVFTRSGAAWSRQGDALTASDGAANDYFGDSVALSGDAALIGAPGGRFIASAAHGVAYRFARSGAVWSQQGNALTASDGAVVDGFGHAVALSADAILVGAPYKQIGANEMQGAAYVFPPNTSLDLAYQLSSKPAGIDPRYASYYDAAIVADALFDGLTSLDAQTSAVLPAVASSWDASANVTVWTFHLRGDARFSNGTPVTAQDFKFTWERLFTSVSAGWAGTLLRDVKGTAALAAGKAEHLSGVVAQNRTTLVVKLTAPFADFPSMVADPCLAPLPRGLLSTAKKARQFRSAPVGNGPFMLAEPWNRKGTVSLAPNPGYSGTAPHIAGITFTVIEDPAAAYAQFQAGKLDVADFPAASLTEVEAAYGTSTDGVTAEPGHQVVPGPTAGVVYCTFNTKKAPLNDVRVRRAFSLALDRTKLVATVPPPTMVLAPATDMLSPGVPGYVPGQWLYAQLDLAQAAALLAAAGFPGGAGLPEITFLTVSQATKSQYVTDLAAIGVKVKFVEVSREQFLPRWGSGNYMMMQDGWNWYPTAADVLYSGFYGPLDGSLSSYDDPAVNAALRRACETLDDAARVAALQSIDATIAADVPVTPITYFNRTVVCSARLHEAVLSQMNVFDFTRVWIE